MGVFTIRSGRHPHEITLLVIFTVSGLSNFFAYDKAASQAITRYVPAVIGQIFYLGLALFSAVALVGVFLPRLIGPLIERAGLLGTTGLFAFFGLAIEATAGIRGLFFATFMIGLAVGNLVRVVQITRDIARIRAAAKFTDSTQQLE